MATIINNPDSGAGNNNGSTGTIVGIILVVLVIILFLMYGLPALRNNDSNGTSVNVPDKVQVDVNSGANTPE